MNLQMLKNLFHGTSYCQFLCHLNYSLSTGFENAIIESISVHRSRHVLLNRIEMAAFYIRGRFLLVLGSCIFLEVIY